MSRATRLRINPERTNLSLPLAADTMRTLRSHRQAPAPGRQDARPRPRPGQYATLHHAGYEVPMELYDVLRTTFAAREFTTDPLPDEVLAKILDHARFAPSGGNRQGWRVIVVRDPATKRKLADLSAFAGRRYAAQAANGENPWNTIDPPRVDPATIERTQVPTRLTESIATAPVVLVVCVDLKVVASIDQNLDRIGIISGASIYPFAWNVLLAARHEGFGGTITTLATAREADIKALLGIPPHIAACAVMPLGRPVRVLTRLKRKPIAEFVTRERWGGPPFVR